MARHASGAGGRPSVGAGIADGAAGIANGTAGASAVVIEPGAPRPAINYEGLKAYGYDFNSYTMDGVIDGPEQMPVLQLRFPILMKEASNPSRTVYYSHYFSWMGHLRELSLYPIREPLARDLRSGEYGMVTNEVTLEVLGHAALNEIMEGSFWVGERTGTYGSTVDLHFDWRRVLPGGDRERAAMTRLRATWVRIVGDGAVELAPCPDYLDAFLESRRPLSGSKTYAPPVLAEPLAALDRGRELYRAPRGPNRAPVLASRDFETELEESNAVGNIYFSNYAVWQGRVRDRFFYEAAPEIFRAQKLRGELACLSSKIQHLREAMPFERVRVTMAVTAIHERGVDLYFEYSRVLPDGRTQKLAHASQQAIWMNISEHGELAPGPLPKRLLDALIARARPVGADSKESAL